MRGPKPRPQNVVPLRSDGSESNLDERAKQRARELKPRGLDHDVAKLWDLLAPPLCHPTVARLKPEYVPLFAELCKVAARLNALRTTLATYAKIAATENATRRPDDHIGPEIYVTLTRNGEQRKTHPEVGQLNECLRQFTMLCDRFGMNPSAARGIAAGDQGELPFGGNEFS